LARSSRPARFAVGELIIAPTEASRDLIVVVEGRAQFLLGRGGEQTVSAEVGEGEVIGLVRTSRRDSYDISVRAVTDCEVVIVDADEAGEIASRNADLATALNQVASVRRRRMERLAGRGAVVQLEQPEGEAT
jgi:CRP-like cAMP-binding protein